jgi:hypothetical protein
MASLRDQIQAKLDALNAQRKLSSVQGVHERWHELQQKALLKTRNSLSPEEKIEYRLLCESIPDESKIIRLENLLKEYDDLMDARSTVQK